MSGNDLAHELETNIHVPWMNQVRDAAKMLRKYNEMEEFFKTSDPMGYQAYLARNVDNE